MLCENIFQELFFDAPKYAVYLSVPSKKSVKKRYNPGRPKT